MIDIKKIRPKRGLLVPYPTSPFLPIPAEGTRVEWNSYWVRRLAEGSIELLGDVFIENSKAKPVKK